jgi:hypothetical protein
MSSRPEFNLSARSGLIAGAISADGVLFAWRNPPTKADGSTNTVGQRLKMLVAKARTVTGFPTAQEVSLAAHSVSVFGSPVADYSGGTDLSNQDAGTDAVRRLGPDIGPKPQQTSVLQTGNVRIATTAALTHAGSPTIKTHPFASDSWFELGTASTVQEGGCDLIWTPSPEGSEHCKGLLYTPGSGFIIKVPIALGATGTLRLWVEVFWEEA